MKHAVRVKKLFSTALLNTAGWNDAFIHVSVFKDELLTQKKRCINSAYR